MPKSQSASPIVLIGLGYSADEAELYKVRLFYKEGGSDRAFSLNLDKQATTAI